MPEVCHSYGTWASDRSCARLASRRLQCRAVLDVLAIVAACFNVLPALVMGVGLDQQGHSGRPLMSAFAAVFLFATPAAVYAVVEIVGDGAAAWLAVAAVPPLAMLALLLADPAALWGNFPPPRAAQRVAQRVGSVALFALPVLLACAAR